MLPWRLIGRRLIVLPPTLLGVLLLTFVLLQVIPGNPVDRMLGERGATAETKARLMAHYGLDRPIHQRFGLYLHRLSKGDFGQLPGTGRSVLSEFLSRLPNTIRLALAAFLLSLCIGIPTGIASGLRPGGRLDIACRTASTLCQSTPVFWFGLAMMYLFAYKLPILPPSGDGQGSLSHLLLPAITLGVRPAAFLQRIVRSSLLDVMGQDYIRTARAKGLGEWIVIGRHALWNAAIPIVTVVAVDLGSLLSGSVITETIFRYRGVGSFIMYGIRNRIYSVVLLASLFTTALFIIVNLVTDILYAVADPRLREGGAGR